MLAWFEDRLRSLELRRVTRGGAPRGDADHDGDDVDDDDGKMRRRRAVSREGDADAAAEEDDRMEVTFAPPPQGFWSVVQLAWGFALVHYIFYGIVVAVLAYFLRSFWIVRAVTAVVFVAYQPSFWDGSELKLGRPWDRLRQHPIWTLSQAYFPAKLIRTRKLDPKKTYVFGWHPHGILILSRIHVYGEEGGNGC